MLVATSNACGKGSLVGSDGKEVYQVTGQQGKSLKLGGGHEFL